MYGGCMADIGKIWREQTTPTIEFVSFLLTLGLFSILQCDSEYENELKLTWE